VFPQCFCTLTRSQCRSLPAKPIKVDIRPTYRILFAQNGHRRARPLFPVAARISRRWLRPHGRGTNDMRFVTACEKQFPIIWHAAANHQPTQRRSRRGLGRRCRAHAAGGAWTGRFPARPADVASTRGASAGRQREMVANHQGGEHEGRMRRGGGCVG